MVVGNSKINSVLEYRLEATFTPQSSGRDLLILDKLFKLVTLLNQRCNFTLAIVLPQLGEES
jgi:hypothetical protein